MHTRIKLMRWLFAAYRFQNLPLGERFFQGVPAGTVVNTPLFGYTIPLEVSRTMAHRLLCLQQEYFIAEKHLFENLVNTGDCVIDVGTNIGYYMLMFQQRIGPSGKVICLEPEPTNLQELKRTIAVNQFQNIELLEVAAGDRQDTICLDPGMNGRVNTKTSAHTVPMIQLDELIPHHPALVKIDVEGFEGQVLTGMQEMMATVKPNLFVEVHPSLLEYEFSVRDVYALLQPHYPNITAWEPILQGNVYQKLRSRYFPKHGIRQLTDLPAVLNQCERGERLDPPFWMICTT